MYQLNLTQFSVEQLNAFAGDALRIVATHLPNPGNITGYNDAVASYEKYSKVATKGHKNYMTKEKMMADKRRLRCYKALYLAAQSHYYLPDEERSTELKSLIIALKITPRSMERTPIIQRDGTIYLLLQKLDTTLSAAVHYFGLVKWVAALVEADAKYRQSMNSFMSVAQELNALGYAANYEPMLIGSINAVYKYINSYIGIYDDKQWKLVKRMIDTIYKKQVTICKRNATRRKNRKLKKEQEGFQSEEQSGSEG